LDFGFPFKKLHLMSQNSEMLWIDMEPEGNGGQLHFSVLASIQKSTTVFRVTIISLMWTGFKTKLHHLSRRLYEPPG